MHWSKKKETIRTQLSRNSIVVDLQRFEDETWRVNGKELTNKEKVDLAAELGQHVRELISALTTLQKDINIDRGRNNESNKEDRNGDGDLS